MMCRAGAAPLREPEKVRKKRPRSPPPMRCAGPCKGIRKCQRSITRRYSSFFTSNECRRAYLEMRRQRSNIRFAELPLFIEDERSLSAAAAQQLPQVDAVHVMLFQQEFQPLDRRAFQLEQRRMGFIILPDQSA